MESYLALFENAVRKQADLVGKNRACLQARKAGLIVSPSGQIVACSGDPTIVLLRLIRSFTEDGSLAALDACGPLIAKMTEIPAELERVS